MLASVSCSTWCAASYSAIWSAGASAAALASDCSTASTAG